MNEFEGEADVVDMELAHKDGFKRVGEGSVADVVEEGGGGEGLAVVGEVEDVAELGHDGGGAEAVFEAGVVGAGEDELGEAELFDEVEALDFWCLEEFEENAADFGVAVDGVADDLGGWVHWLYRGSKTGR